MESPNQTTVVVVDDDVEIRELVGKFLSQHQLNVLLAENGEELFTILENNTCDCIVLDVMMPGDDGFEVCRKLRASSQIPVIMLTAVTDDTDKIIGLELGADDYLTKPFNPRELLARIKAILRRHPNQAVATETINAQGPAGTCYLFEGWRLDKEARNLTASDDVEISLSTGEYDLLIAMVQNSGRVLNRDQLLDMTKNRSAGPFDRSIDIQISRLRQKIEANPKKPKLIKTVRGGGYMFTAKVKVLHA